MLAGQHDLETEATMRAAARAAWVARWSGLLAVAAQRAIAADWQPAGASLMRWHERLGRTR